MTITLPETSGLTRDNENRAALIASWQHGLESAIALAFGSMKDKACQEQVYELLAPLPDAQRESLLVGMTAAADQNEDAALYDLARMAAKAITAALRDAFGGAR